MERAYGAGRTSGLTPPPGTLRPGAGKTSMNDEVSMDSWAIDSYGLRAAHSRNVLDRIRGTDRLHVSPLTWSPGDGAAASGAVMAGLTARPTSPARLSAVDSDASRARTPDLVDRLHELHDQGVLIVTGEHECDPQLVADVEGSWEEAGLVWPATSETFCAVMTADRLGMSLITDDSDVGKLARHWHVQPMTVAEFASQLAA